ncbi:MAG: anaerobic ribonucleoside-triphosphate reductase activating protein [Clostridia bacterium]|nr:anaerobic ribonucleoside-triphosphate reductase activating protein [Clostridia bacterium]
MLIKGFQRLTLLDFPGRTACTVFTGGCNFRCPFCHNAGLVTEPDDDEFDESEIFDHLEKRRRVLDGVAVTGGEPLLQPDIERFLYELKDRGYAVKLDTNGSFPDKLAGILELKLVDYVAMDVKNRPEKYAETIGLPQYDLAPVEQSMKLLRESGVDYEFRTTVVERFHTPDDIAALAQWIAGAPRYFLQNFVDSGHLIDETCRGVPKAVMVEMLERARAFVPAAELRGL